VGTPRFASPAPLIHARPAIAEARGRIGDWEGDLIVGRSSQSAIGTVVCRRSRLIRLLHLPDGRSADHLRDAIRDTLAGVPEDARRTLVWDQGSELACHDEIADLFTDGVFFAEPGKPWQRPTNENGNGLLRQYFPRGTDLSRHTRADLDIIEHRINSRPRKTHGWRSPLHNFHRRTRVAADDGVATVSRIRGPTSDRQFDPRSITTGEPSRQQPISKTGR
jgi:transposase, IS30 family